METDRFDRLTRTFSLLFSRRSVAGALGLGAIAIPGLAEGRKKHKKRKKKKKVTRNAFGCVNVGGFCKNSGQCCSGICEGEKGKKKCKAHDTGGCTGEQHSCDGDVAPCITTTGENGFCARTTGNAGYCQISSNCFPYTRDTDCQAMSELQAACVVCELECGPNGTACVGPSEGEYSIT